MQFRISNINIKCVANDTSYVKSENGRETFRFVASKSTRGVAAPRRFGNTNLLFLVHSPYYLILRT